MRVSQEAVAQERQAIERTLSIHKVMANMPRLLGKLPEMRVEQMITEPLPKDEPVVVLASHHSSFDAHALPYAYLQETGLPLSLWAKEEILNWPLAGGFLKTIGAIATTRDKIKSNANREAVKLSKARLKAGGSIGIFVETRRVYGGDILPISTLGATLAEHAGVRIVTAGIYEPKRESPYAPRPVTVVFGQMTDPAEISKDQRAEFYREQIQHDYDTALLLHHDRPLAAQAHL